MVKDSGCSVCQKVRELDVLKKEQKMIIIREHSHTY